MNADEVSQVVAMMRAHYGPRSGLEGRSLELMLETWTAALATVPLKPHGMNALEWWFAHEDWPPQAANIRNRAREAMASEERAARDAATRERYPRPALGAGWMDRAKRPTATNEEITAAVVELAIAWAAGEIGLTSVRRQSTGYERFVAVNHARVEVMPLIEALCEEDERRLGIVRTHQGAFTRQDLHEHGGIAGIVNGQRVVRWPTSGWPGAYRYGER